MTFMLQYTHMLNMKCTILYTKKNNIVVNLEKM